MDRVALNKGVRRPKGSSEGPRVPSGLEQVIIRLGSFAGAKLCANADRAPAERVEMFWEFRQPAEWRTTYGSVA